MIFDFRNTKKLATVQNELTEAKSKNADLDQQLSSVKAELDVAQKAKTELEQQVEKYKQLLDQESKKQEELKKQIIEKIDEQEKKIDDITDLKAVSLLAAIGHDPVEEKPEEETVIENLFKDYKSNRNKILSMIH